MDEIIIKKIKLQNFRSHESFILDCEKKTTQILGENGSGKTSVLEAIYITTCGKSFRAVDREIVQRETDFYRVELEYMNGEKIVATYDVKNLKKQFLYQDKKTTRLAATQKYPVILFLPEDLHIVSSSPARRRDYFDRVLSQLDPKYNTSLARYNKALRQRNELLKRDGVTEEMMFSWNVLMARYGVYIRRQREKLIKDINERLTKTYRTIAKNQDSVEIKYCGYTGDVDESGYMRLLTLDFERDVITGHTNFGTHKDDYKFIFNGVEADGSASRGETRSMILALKFIEAELIYETQQKKPLILLDDVFSELDKERQKSLVTNFQNHQVILTSVEGV